MDISAYYKSCRLCPRSCGADRLDGQLGRCRVPAQIIAARAALHFWEEPCISGDCGSGAVFFSGCSLGCLFCQNREISGGQSGKEISIERLAEIFLELQGKGAANINLVTPDHYAPSIIKALELAREKGLALPVLCNCSGYMSPETQKMLADYVDIWLPDFKYYDGELAGRLSGAPDYFAAASAALAEMLRAAGPAVFDEDGMIRRGVIVRHLVLPGHTGDSMQVIRYLHETYGNDIYISIMNQYTPPAGPISGFPELSRKLTEEEYDQVVDFAVRIGVENGFIQEGETAEESFIPPFDNEGL